VQGVTSRDLRLRAVGRMRADWPHYRPFIEDHLLPNYLSKMARSSEYAGEAELVAISDLHGVKIHVWGADEAHDRTIQAFAHPLLDSMHPRSMSRTVTSATSGTTIGP